MRDHVVYRAYDAGGYLLYIGMSSGFMRRLGQHSAEAAWWGQVARVEIEHLPSRRAAYARETALIDRLRPLHNRPPGPRFPHPMWLARDERIVQLRQEGKLCSEIAEDLGISQGALEKVLKRLLAAGKITRRPPGRVPPG